MIALFRLSSLKVQSNTTAKQLKYKRLEFLYSSQSKTIVITLHL